MYFREKKVLWDGLHSQENERKKWEKERLKCQQEKVLKKKVFFSLYSTVIDVKWCDDVMLWWSVWIAVMMWCYKDVIIINMKCCDVVMFPMIKCYVEYSVCLWWSDVSCFDNGMLLWLMWRMMSTLIWNVEMFWWFLWLNVMLSNVYFVMMRSELLW